MSVTVICHRVLTGAARAIVRHAWRPVGPIVHHAVHPLAMAVSIVCVAVPGAVLWAPSAVPARPVVIPPVVAPSPPVAHPMPPAFLSPPSATPRELFGIETAPPWEVELFTAVPPVPIPEPAIGAITLGFWWLMMLAALRGKQIAAHVRRRFK